MTARFGARTRPSESVSQLWGKRPLSNWNPVPVTALTAPISVVADATIHTKGAWTELIASTSAEGDCLDLIFEVALSGQNSSTLIDFAVGASGSEVPIIENLAIGGAVTAANFGYKMSIPVYIPAGSRLSARTQSLVSSKSISVLARISSGPNPAMTSPYATVSGTSTATSAGTQLSGTNNVWTEVVASTSTAFESLLIVPSVSSANVVAAIRPVSLGIGSSGNEVTIANRICVTTSFEAITLDARVPVLQLFPVGSRLAATMTQGASAVVYACVVGTERIGR